MSVKLMHESLEEAFNRNCKQNDENKLIVLLCEYTL